MFELMESHGVANQISIFYKRSYLHVTSLGKCNIPTFRIPTSA